MKLNFFSKIELLFILQGIIIAFFFGKGTKSILITAISLIGVILLIHLIKFIMSLKPTSVSHSNLFNLIGENDIDKLKDYIKTNNIKINQMHEMKYYGQVTPIIYAMSKEAYDVFRYLLENGYDINQKNVGHPPLLYAAYYPDVKYIKELLKYSLNLYVTNNEKYSGNALEIALWRGRKKVVKALLAKGMKFSLEEYKKSKCGNELLPWEQIKRELKVLLLENYVFNQKKQMFYLNELCLQKKLNIGIFNSKHYFVENLLNA